MSMTYEEFRMLEALRENINMIWSVLKEHGFVKEDPEKTEKKE